VWLKGVVDIRFQSLLFMEKGVEGEECSRKNSADGKIPNWNTKPVLYYAQDNSNVITSSAFNLVV
jgi:hypothetical protein